MLKFAVAIFNFPCSKHISNMKYGTTHTRMPQQHYTRAKIDQVDATLFIEQRLNNVVIKVQQLLLN